MSREGGRWKRQDTETADQCTEGGSAVSGGTEWIVYKLEITSIFHPVKLLPLYSFSLDFVICFPLDMICARKDDIFGELFSAFIKIYTVHVQWLKMLKSRFKKKEIYFLKIISGIRECRYNE